jgi:hypothetical protein
MLKKILVNLRNPGEKVDDFANYFEEKEADKPGSVFRNNLTFG